MISKAATLEGVEELTSAYINGLVDRYAAWLMTNLTEASCATTVNGDTHAAATKMIGEVCTKIYQRADQSIIKTHPELADCAVAGNCGDPAAPASPQPAPADKRNIGNGNIGNSNIGMGGLDVAFAIPSKPSTSGYHVHIGTYRNNTDAHRAHHLLEQLDHCLLYHVFFNVEPQQRRNAIYYDLVSAPLPKHHVSALCAVLWQQKMGYSVSFAP